MEELPRPGFGSLIKESGRFYGGRAPNVAIMMSMLGCQTCIIAAMGNDFQSSGYESFLENWGVLLEGLYKDDSTLTDRSFIFTTSKQDQITFVQLDAYRNFENMKVPDNLLSRTRIVHFSSGCPEYNLKAAKAARSYGSLLSFDLGNDAYLHTDAYLSEMIGSANFIFMNAQEFEYLKTRMQVCEITQLITPRHLEAAIVINGMESVDLYSGNVWRTFPLNVQKAKDRTGASDGFIAGFLTGYLKGLDLDKSVKLGSHLLNRVVQRLGCLTNVPSWDELLSLIQ
ncbi:MAG: PfkB family carbohydrate kinase [Desulfitobacteriaceae bacterium]|nr:PfkB family carbohydrate kinase [Desulfitobacteriaceae bacterium]